MGVLCVRLLYPTRDFDSATDGRPGDDVISADLEHDLGLEHVLNAMASGDPALLDIARMVLLSNVAADVDTIRHRQGVLADCLAHPDVIRQLYAIAVEGTDAKRRSYFGIFGRYPGTILSGHVELLHLLVGTLRGLRHAADAGASRFRSPGLTALCTLLGRELTDDYLAEVEQQLDQLRLRHGVALSAKLGRGNGGTDYVLRRPRSGSNHWFDRLLGRGPSGYTFHIPERDEASARAFSELRDRALNEVANAVAQSTDHVVRFFETLRNELAFYVACLNLHDQLVGLAVPLCIPVVEPAQSGALVFDDLVDVSLALAAGRRPVGNGLNLSGRQLVVVTGANQGGKSTFLRALGLAQLLLSAGVFVGATAFTGEVANGLFTHAKREEDPTMTQGKLDEELRRLSAMADRLVAGSWVLFNESFAATNEHEGSEIARQVVTALVEQRVRVVIVTHLHEFAKGLFDSRGPDAAFLRAERREDGQRTFKLSEGAPLATSFGADVYQAVFGQA